MLNARHLPFRIAAEFLPKGRAAVLRSWNRVPQNCGRGEESIFDRKEILRVRRGKYKELWAVLLRFSSTAAHHVPTYCGQLLLQQNTYQG